MQIMSNVVLRGKEVWQILWKDLTCIWIGVLTKREGSGDYSVRAKLQKIQEKENVSKAMKK